MRVRFNDFILDTDRRELFRGKEQIPLRPKALDLLRILIENRPKAVAQEELYDRLWPKTFVGRANIHKIVHHIREALGDADQTIVRTVYGFGFSFAADAFKEVGTREIKKVPALRGKTLVNFFVEPSTRTRTSFELAAIRLSADVINISASSSSLIKGETLKDTAKILEAYHADLIVLRHSSSGAPQFPAMILFEGEKRTVLDRERITAPASLNLRNLAIAELVRDRSSWLGYDPPTGELLRIRILEK